jgi:predicted metal-dependent hydrolase
MPASSSSTWSTVGFRPLAGRQARRLESHPDLPLPILLCPIRSARRMRLRLDDSAALLKLTHPRHVRAAAALEWAASQKQWVARQLAQALPPLPFEPGGVIPVEGRDVTLHWDESEHRCPRMENGRIVCGGPRQGFERRIAQFLRRLALQTLSAETAEAAGRAGLRAAAVSVGDARTRWGSCSSNGSLRYNWRLILAPVDARRYVVAHEVAHLRHLDHGPRFKALESELFDGDEAAAQRLLRSEGPRLRRIGIAR